jgi:hypothetical protein
LVARAEVLLTDQSAVAREITERYLGRVAEDDPILNDIAEALARAHQAGWHAGMVEAARIASDFVSPLDGKTPGDVAIEWRNGIAAAIRAALPA